MSIGEIRILTEEKQEKLVKSASKENMNISCPKFLDLTMISVKPDVEWQSVCLNGSCL